VVVALILIAVGGWYFSQLRPEPKPKATGPLSGVTVPAGQNPRVEAPVAELGPTPGNVRVNPKDGLKYVRIPPGAFMMGCSPKDSGCGRDEKPPHHVTITKGFWMGQTEVTVGAYKRFEGVKGQPIPPEPLDDHQRPLNPYWSNEAMPMVNVMWDDAQAYCGWAGGRLPTEAEWEYAARAGSTAARYGDLDEIAWYAGNSGGHHFGPARVFVTGRGRASRHLDENGSDMYEVGQKRANGFALYDMLGNVWEWVNDWYDKNYYHVSPPQDPSGPTSGLMRVVRGGNWNSHPGERPFIDPWAEQSRRVGGA
jgi:formylglycine-generating enzyme required for sulfatase activity